MRQASLDRVAVFDDGYGHEMSYGPGPWPLLPSVFPPGGGSAGG